MSDSDWDGEIMTYLEDCTCEHEPEEHNWVSCTVDGCECGGHITE